MFYNILRTSLGKEHNVADKVRIRRVVRSRGWAHPGFRLPVWLLAAALVLLGLCLALAALPFMEKREEPAAVPASGKAGDLVIREVMSSNRFAVPDDNGAFPDWVELVNCSGGSLDVTGWTLRDGEDRIVPFTFPKEVLAEGECLLIYCSGVMKNVSGHAYHAPFRLSAQGETLILADAAGGEVDRLEFPALPSNQVYAMDAAGKWQISGEYTPGLENTSQAHAQWKRSRGVPAVQLVISEVMSANRSYADERGGCGDYVELYNRGESALDLSGYALSDDEGRPGKWRFPEGARIGAGETLLLRRDQLSFGISSGGETLLLSDNSLRPLDQMVVPPLAADRSCSRIGERTTTAYPPTPGYTNDQAGLDQVEAALRMKNPGGLILHEAVSSPRAPNANKSSDDWVELYNGGGQSVDLSGYGLSDDPGRPRKWRFPQGASIAPGQHLVVLLNGADKHDVPTGRYAASFRLNHVHGETLILSASDGTLIDRLPMLDQAAAVSFGRVDGSGYYYLETMTPGATNIGEGRRGKLDPVTFSRSGGPVDQAFTLSLTAPEEVAIHYTLDASEPSLKSPVYSGPLAIDKTTVVRAKAFRDGYVPSLTASACYLFGLSHTMPVVSIITDPGYLHDKAIGIYSMGEKELKYPYKGANFFKDWERAAYVEYFGLDGTAILSQGAGLSLQGQYSRMRNQKAFKVTARNAYGKKSFDASLFPNREYTSYRSFILRPSGQDAKYTRMRDAVLTSLAEDTGVMFQDGFPVIVYVNGEYFGHYNMRERIHKHSIAQREGWKDPDAIDLVKGNSTVKQGTNKDYAQFLSWLKKNGCTTPENLARVEEMVDIENYLEYVALEMYIGNTDLLNVKRYRNRSEGDGRWKWILFDTDWAFYTDTDSFRRWLDPAGAGSGKKTDNTLFVQLMKNKEIRERFFTILGHHMYSSWRSELVLAKIDAWYDALLPEMPAQFERWGGNMKRWNTRVKELRRYASERPQKMLGYIRRGMGWSRDEMRVYFGDIMDELGM